jgi:hypothetical protein
MCIRYDRLNQKMNDREAAQIATDLLKLMRTGNDARTQIDFICNKLRIKKTKATYLQENFESGVHAGCDSVINGNNDLGPVEEPHPLYVAAYHLGRKDFKAKLEEQRHKHKSKIFFDGYKLILFTMLVLIIVIIFYFLF